MRSTSVVTAPLSAEKRAALQELLNVITSVEFPLDHRHDQDVSELQAIAFGEETDAKTLQRLLTNLIDDPKVKNALEADLQMEAGLQGHSSLVNALKIVFSDVDNVVDSGTNMADWMITWPRLWQVFSNIFANGTNDDSNNPNGAFSQIVSGSVTWALIVFGIGSFFIGVLQRIYQQYRKQELMSYKHLKKREQEFDDAAKPQPQTIAADLDKILQHKMAGAMREEITDENGETKKISYTVNRANQNHIRFLKVVETSESDAASSAMPDTSVRKTRIALSPPEENLEQAFQPNFFIRGFNKIRNSKVGKWLADSWVTSVLNVMFFWVGWYPLMLAVGTVVAVSSPFWSLISLAPVAAYISFKGLQYIARRAYQKWGTKEPSETQEIEDEIVARELTQRYIIQKEHAFNRRMIAEAFSQAGTYAENEAQLKEQWKQKKAKRHHKYQYAEKVYLSKTKVGEYLLGTENAKNRTRLSPVKNFLDGFVLTLFLLWLASTVVLAPAAIALVPVAVSAFLGTSAGWIGGVFVGSIVGGAMGLIMGVNSYASTQEAHAKYQEKVLQKLSAPYSGLDNNQALKHLIGNEPEQQMTKLEKFQQLENSVEKKKADIIRLRNELKRLNGKSLLSDAEKEVALRYDLKKVNVYNDYYFEKQTHKPSAFTWLKKGAVRAFEFLGGTQSGVYLTRFFLLGGLGLAGALAMTGYGLPVVIGVAAAAGLVYGGIRLVNYELERRRQHKNFFLETFDARLHYMNAKENELSSVKKLLRIKVEQAQAVKTEEMEPTQKKRTAHPHKYSPLKFFAEKKPAAAYAREELAAQPLVGIKSLSG